jgi:antagonist of KipI
LKVPIDIEVLHPGVFTTVQDGGRPGFAYFAVPRSGPACPADARRANELVGNSAEAALLEFGLQGAKLAFATEATVALTGADLRWRCDGRAVARDRVLRMGAGSVLEGGFAVEGRFGYLAVSGTLIAEPELGSVSMHARLHGRLEKGTRLRFGPPLASEDAMFASPVATPGVLAAFRLELLPGPEWTALEATSQHDLLHATWHVSPQSDRVGTRLAGPSLHLRTNTIFESVPVWIGCVQVDPGGTPLVVGVDGGVVVGYPRVATLVGTRT